MVINELLAANDSGLQDEDGDRSDWIELHNTTAEAVDLTGWRLTDDQSAPSKWTFPAVSIPAGDYLLVFASGKDRAVAGQPLHANFSLNRAGEYLALVDPAGTIQDVLAPFPEQLADVSFGLGVAATGEEPLVGEQHPVRVLVPTTASAAAGLSWTEVAYDDSSWLVGAGGVGYERSPGGSIDYTSYIDTDVNALMPAGRNTAYLRLAFDAADVDDLANLTLQMRYDDGFVAYLNGQEIARRYAPATPTWNSAATGQNGDSNAVLYETFDVAAFSDELLEGANVLAIHGLNANNSSDFLQHPLLVASRTLPTQRVYMAAPTPGAANALGTLGFVADTEFSADRGFYDEPFDVLITSDTADAVIRYTLDGSAPTAASGLIYDPASPPQITTTTILRAAAYKTGLTPSNVDTQTYIFLDDVLDQDGSGLPAHAAWGWQGPDWAMDPEVVNDPAYAATLRGDLLDVPTVSLVMPWETWFGGGGEGIYISGENVERPGSIELFNAPGSGEFQINGALEIVGGTSTDRWKTDKLSIRATFKEPFGPTDLDAAVFSTTVDGVDAADEFDSLIFDAQINYTWPYGGSWLPYDQRGKARYVQDQYAADLQNLLGGQAPHGRFVHLYINGLYWGMYDMHELPDESFAASYLGGDKDDYDVIKHTATTVVAGDATAAANYGAMLATVRQDLANPANYAAAAEAVDLPGLINYMLVNYYIGNEDWAHHNWYASYNRVAADGKWRFHSWDAEHVLKNLSYNATLAGNYGGSPEEVHLALMANDEYRLLFSDLVHKHMSNGGLLTPAGASAAYQARVQEVQRALVAESARWGDSRTTSAETPGAGGAYTRDDWLATQNDMLVNYFPQRTDVVVAQFDARNWLVSLAAPVFSQHGGTVPTGTTITLQKPPRSPGAALLYYTLDGSDPRLPGGGVAPGAIVANSGTADLVIDAGVRVRARVFDSTQTGTAEDWSAESDATFVLDSPLPLRITELHYNPTAFAGVADEQDLEFIELTNVGVETISLDGLTLADFAAAPYAFAAGHTLEPGARIVVARNPAALQAAYGAGINVAAAGYGPANLSNGGETVTLLGSQGEVLQQVNYQDDDGWPTAADGDGRSLTIVDPWGDSSDAANWQASYYVGGSPGADGAPPAVAGDFTGDDAVRGDDFLTWQRGFGTPALESEAGQGDADGDRDTDAADLAQWTLNYGVGAAGELASAMTVADAASLVGLAQVMAETADAAVERGSQFEAIAAGRRGAAARSAVEGCDVGVASSTQQQRDLIFSTVQRWRVEDSIDAARGEGDESAKVIEFMDAWRLPDLLR